MVIYAQVVYIHLGDRVWVCVHNYGLHEERIHAEQGCVILQVISPAGLSLAV